MFNNITNDAKNFPVKNDDKIQTILCSEFKGKFSSITGIIARGLYIGKINQLTGTPENPEIKIVCGPECKETCKNIIRPRSTEFNLL